MSLDLRLMVLIGADSRPSPEAAAAQAAAGGATMIQFRAKGLSTRDWLEAARKVVEACRPSAVPVVINDRLDIALAVGALGVHLGPEDLPPREAVRLRPGPEFLVGASARAPERALELEAAGVDYLGVGALRASASKPEAVPVGLEGIRAVSAAVRIPVVAIGGVTPEDVAALKAAGARGTAVLSGVGGDLRERARLYRRAWDSA